MPPDARYCRHSCKPSNPGSCQSNMTISYGQARSSSSPSVPVLAVSTVYFSAANHFLTTFVRARSSSIIKTLDMRKRPVWSIVLCPDHLAASLALVQPRISVRPENDEPPLLSPDPDRVRCFIGQ